LNLKFLNELAASNDRNFKFTALDLKAAGELVMAGLVPGHPA
jgi:hypothetical protein